MTRDRRSGYRTAQATLLALLAGGSGVAGTAASGAEAPTDPLTEPDGQAVFERHCSRCHQPDGNGIAGIYPDLHDLPASAGERGILIRGVLAGRSSADHDDAAPGIARIMPTHGYLGNETIAAALTYVIAQWSDAGPPVSTDEVARERLALLSAHHSGPGTGADAAPGAGPGTSPLADLQTTQYLTSDGPAMTVEEFERARRLYYGRCTGCHGVLRHGTAGNPLTPELMRSLGTDYLQTVIAFGASGGMPGWGSDGDLSGQDINLLARYLQHPVPEPPDMDPFDVRDSWQVFRTLAERPGVPEHDYDLDALFVVLLHDVGELALIDGVSKTVVGRVEVGRSPSRVVADPSGRYLYVIGRDGTVSQVDLYAAPPERVASVRVGFEARAIAASRGAEDGTARVLAGAFWPPQLVLLDGRTLEPLRQFSTRNLADSDSGEADYHPEPRVSDIVASPRHREFLAQIKDTGQVMLIPHGDANALPRVSVLRSVRELRAGSFSVDDRYYLTPSDTRAVSVFDTRERRIVAQVAAPVYGGNPGTAYDHQRFGPVWATSTMATDQVILIGTDPERHPDQAWQVVETAAGGATGSLFLSTHPGSAHLWMDTPLAADPEASQSVAVFRRQHLEQGFTRLPVATWSGLEQGPRRVLQPTYSRDGREVWMVVWNPQTMGSAVVVVDDASLEPVAAIRAPELITATRIYGVGALRAAAAGQEAPAGADRYQTHCGNCHGRYGEGDGPMAPSLATSLKDLRQLSARNGGEFPEAFVREIVDGRRLQAQHRPEDMPIWGAELGGGAETEAAIDEIVAFLEAIQQP